MRILIGQINPTIGDFEGNAAKILDAIHIAQETNCQLVVFPELCLTGYPPDDLLLLPQFMNAVEHYVEKIAQATAGITALLGTPRRHKNALLEKPLYNSCAIITDKKITGYRDKSLLPTYDVFDERRYFAPARTNQPVVINGTTIALTICEDIWATSSEHVEANYFHDPLKELAKNKIDLHINISASPYSLDKFDRRVDVCKKASLLLNCPTIQCNQIGGNDSLIFDGNSLFIDAKGNIIACAKAFAEDCLMIDSINTDIASQPQSIDPVAELHAALVLGIKDYFSKQGFRQACIGLSGGIDSALVACLATEALGKDNVHAIAMPSRYSSSSSMDDAVALANNLGIDFKVIPIEEVFSTYLKDLTPYFEGKPQDVTEENLQARIRGCMLMAMSNKHGWLVLSTGNKSELAMGYATLYGDMCGGLSVISDVSKQMVYALAQYINKKRNIIPMNIITKEPSAELKPNQKDSDSLPPYAIIDKVLHAYVVNHQDADAIAAENALSVALVKELIKKIHRNEYKRRQSAPSLRVTDKAFSVGRRFPIVQKWIN